jgi:hypothetical protein
MDGITVGFLMQVDKLVRLLESIFVHLRLQLLDIEGSVPCASTQSIYGLLMCLPWGDAFLAQRQAYSGLTCGTI